jgi:ABC-type transporter Mla subunit MlaD
VLFIDEGVDVPRSTVAVIRPKTLFGEKFVDLVPGRLEGGSAEEAYGDGDTIDGCTAQDLTSALGGGSDEAEGCTVGAVELERVLADLYPILQAVDPDDLMTILDELATGAEGTGEAVSRSLVNGAALLEVQADNNDNTAAFLEDLALLTAELADRGPDLIGGARDLNAALPVLTRNGESFTALLEQLERLATQGAELLEGNTAFIDAVYTDGQAALDTLFANRDQIIPLVVGVGSYLDILGSLGHILGGQACVLPICPTPSAAAAAAPPTGAPTAPAATAPPPTIDGEISSGTQAVLDLFTGLLGGRS